MNPNLPNLWLALRTMFTRMQSAVGAHIAKEELRRIRAWLAPVIAMARKVVLIEALALAREAMALAPKRAAKRQTKRSLQRTPNLRLWPKPKRTGPRIRQLGPPVLVRDIWRENARAAAAERLRLARLNRAPPLAALTRRIHALARLMDDPTNAIRRLARKLRASPKTAIALGAKRMPRTRLYDVPEYGDAYAFGFKLGVAHAYPDTS
jgi:hypothetical protein